MSLLQKAVETYDAHTSLAGKVESASYAGADGKAVKACQPLAPIGHTITSADLEITLDGGGHFPHGHPAGTDGPGLHAAGI